MVSTTLSSEELQEVYKWVDSMPLSRVKRNIARDFSDSVLLSEIVHNLFPNLVDLHNYSASNAVKQKTYNWQTLNRKVLRKFGFQLKKEEIDDVVNCKRGAIEKVLNTCRLKFEEYAKQRAESRRMRSGILSRSGSGRQPQSLSPSQRAVSDSAPRRNQEPSKKAAKTFTPDFCEVITEKDRQIQHMTDKLEIMELKVQKLEQLLRLKDSKIEVLQHKIMRQGSRGN